MINPIYILNGPNLNLIGVREPHLYGRQSLADIEKRCDAAATRLGLTCSFRQTNHEGQLIDWVHEARTRSSGVIINPAGYSFSSIALLDALKALELPIIEVHITNIYRREIYYRESYISQAADGVICGLGPSGYEIALHAMAERLGAQSPDK